MSCATLSQEETKILNETLFEKLASNDAGMKKEAIDAINDFTRLKVREDSFFYKIMPPLTITNDDLDRQVDTEKPVKVVDFESDSPAAISVPFASLPVNYYLRGRRYLVHLARILTPRATKDVDELRTWIMDVRQVFSDNAIKDIAVEHDRKFIGAVDSMLVGPGVTLPYSGTVQYQQGGGGIGRESLWDSLMVMPETPFSLETHTCLVNHITIKELCKMGFDEMGGSFSEDIMRKGWSEQDFAGVRWIITIKKTLVPKMHQYMFADPKFIGKHYLLEDTTMYIRREAYMLEFFAYLTSGSTLAHPGGLAHYDYTA